jgi:hypothetical protein
MNYDFSYIINVPKNYDKSNLECVLDQLIKKKNENNFEIIIACQEEIIIENCKSICANNEVFNKGCLNNAGALNSESDIFVFCDFNILIDWKSILNLVEHCKTYWDATFPKIEINLPFDKVEIEKITYNKYVSRHVQGVEGLLVIKKEAFFKINGWDENFFGYGYENYAVFEKIQRCLKFKAINFTYLRLSGYTYEQKDFLKHYQINQRYYNFIKNKSSGEFESFYKNVKTNKNYMHQDVTYRILREQKSNLFGDCLLASLFVHVLNDNRINAFLDITNNEDVKNFVDCQLVSQTNNILDYNFVYFNDKSYSILETAIQHFKMYFLINQKIEITKKHIPVKFFEDDLIPNIDVVMVTKSGNWAPVRNWPYFEQLKSELTILNISWFDLTENNVKNNEFLNYVKKSKVFLTIETGASHFASQFVNKQNSLVIQSGFCDNSFWNFYDYDIISNDTDCKSCFLLINDCPIGHMCMREITVDKVISKILKKLGKE